MTSFRVSTGAPAQNRGIAAPAPRRWGRSDELQQQPNKLMSRMRIAVIYGVNKTVDRINRLFSQRRGTVTHPANLLA